MREKHVMTYVMGQSRTPAVGGSWREWNNMGNRYHNPNTINADGLRDIASVYYPSIGPYDVTDPDYQEYMMQLCKMCYIDTINYYVRNSGCVFDETNDWSRSFDNLTVEMLHKYGLSSSARLGFFPEDYENEAGNTLTALIEKLGDTVLTIEGRPLLGQFSMRAMTIEQVIAWKESYANTHGGIKPFLMVWRHGTWKSSDWMQVSDGQFGWIELDDSSVQTFRANGDFLKYADLKTAKANHDSTVAEAKQRLASGELSFYAEALTPGFDSTGCWGWQTGPSRVDPGENGELYEYKWQAAVKNDFPMVIIPTWDDWWEASTIEPSLQYGTTYLEITRKYAAAYKGIEANTANLELPGWIYKIRKTTSDAEVLTAMETACQLIADGNYHSAEAFVRPYVEITGVPATSKTLFDYPMSQPSEKVK